MFIVARRDALDIREAEHGLGPGGGFLQKLAATPRPHNLYQRPSFLTDMGPFALADGCDGSGLTEEAVPCFASSVDDVVVGVEDAV